LEGAFWAVLRRWRALWWVVSGVLGRGFWSGGGFMGDWWILQPLFLNDKQAHKKKAG